MIGKTLAFVGGIIPVGRSWAKAWQQTNETQM